jgi:hypothetical protein
LRYWQVGGRGQGLGAEKTQSQRNAENGDESHLSSARFVGLRYLRVHNCRNLLDNFIFLYHSFTWTADFPENISAIIPSLDDYLYGRCAI